MARLKKRAQHYQKIAKKRKKAVPDFIFDKTFPDMVKHKELIFSTKKVIYHKTEGFGKVLWELTLDNIN
ncbi:hypothetical protein RhiirA1_479634 [Rhizophagus irregularis]|uniref:Uncharacterized protein n=1 Tax=Rhizophagus irregularis TaxID=588596 RepID=A0A2N0QQF0_9GLOM|nr:hypothetical protein RhiirA1_479634 [Rhizophagus irregularis]GET53042.1 hypothetical protein GLOIN_2v1776597 [Rhizophagus irregularis DAOM 181602=DAOM 197198]